MMAFLSKLRTKISFSLPEIFCLIVLIIASGIPVLYSLGRINLGYDTFLPLIPEHSFKNAYQWTDRANGIYTLNLYVVWLFILDLLHKTGLDLYQSSSVLQFCIFFLSGLGMARMFNLFNKGNIYYSLIPAVFFIYSPFMLDYMLYQTGIVGIVWSIYFFLKFLKQKCISLSDSIYLSLCFLVINDLPNPKYHFMLVLTFILIVLISTFLKLLNWPDLKRNFIHFIVLVLLSVHLIVPFVVFGYSFAIHNEVTINVKKNYASTGETLDYGVAQIHKMIRLFHTPNLNSEYIDTINGPYFFLSYYVLPILVLGVFPFLLYKYPPDERKRFIVIYLLALFFIFLSKGANPPFGLIYEVMLLSQLFSFMRTTAGFVVFASVFYALIIGIVFQHFIQKSKYKKISTIFIGLMLITWGYHLWSGIFFLNHRGTYIDDTKHGINIPNDYFDAAKSIAGNKLDAKIDIYPAQEGYQHNAWGYFGFIFYDWLMKQPTISFEKNTIEGKIKSAVNVKYILHDKSAISKELIPENFTQFKKVFGSKHVDIYEIPPENFIPHIYIPSSVFFTDKIDEEFLLKTAERTSLPAYLSLINDPKILLTIPAKVEKKIAVEYKKINPTKYRIKVNHVDAKFPLVFLENFHPFWKIYSVKSKNLTYKGNGFIYQNVSGTVQNDTMPDGTFYETMFSQELKDTHLLVNKYFNAWLIDPNEICNRKIELCTRNKDGSYNMELIIEFWPQQIVYIGINISALTAIIIVIYNVLKRRKR